MYLLLLSVHLLMCIIIRSATMSFNMQQGQAECTMHRLYCYKQHDNHTNLWMKIILPAGVMVILFWYETHDVRDQEIAVPNYNIFRHDRNRHCGGILDSYITSVPPLIWKSLLFVYKVEIVKLAFHFFIDLPVLLQLFLILFVNIWSHSTLPSFLILFCLEILLLIL